MAENDIIIIGGGPSVLDFDINQITPRGLVIGVNDAAIHADVDVAVSMDRLWFENRYQMLLDRELPTYIRRSATQNIIERHLEGFNLFECDNESNRMSKDERILNGTNSGMCAVNLAYVWKPKRVWLFGFDMKRADDGRPYWYPPYPWAKPEGGTGAKKYAQWADQFEDIFLQFADAGIMLMNVNERSAIKGVPQVSIGDFFKEVKPC